MKRPTGAGGRSWSDSIYLRSRHESHNGLAPVTLPFQSVGRPQKGFSGQQCQVGTRRNKVPAIKGLGCDLESRQAMKGSLTPAQMSQCDPAQILLWSNPPFSSKSLLRFQPWLV